MNTLKREKRVQVVAGLVEGCSIASTARMVGVSENTIGKFILEMGTACFDHEDRALRGLLSERIQADELWAFCFAKDKNLPPSMKDEPGVGSIWTWTALCADTKLLISWLMGKRDMAHASAFCRDLASRVVVRPQLTTDALGIYAKAVKDAFGAKGIDYAVVHKVYSREVLDEARYSPPQCIAITKKRVYGKPLKVDATTSHVERNNLTVRMSQRRWTRLTNGYSKSFSHMECAFAIHAFWYNWVRRHTTLKGKTPAMANDLATHPWSYEEMVGLLEAKERAAVESGKLKRGKYRKRTPKLVQ